MMTFAYDPGLGLCIFVTKGGGGGGGILDYFVVSLI